MKKLALLILAFTLTSCSLVHKMDIEQGNVITPQMVNQLRVGMTEQQVTAIMGTPTLLNTFTKDRVDYVYTNQPGNGKFYEKSVTLIFKHNRVVEIQKKNI